jgi:transcriptional regulator with XRE-family HTH domain
VPSRSQQRSGAASVFGSELRRRREAAGVTQRQLAEAVHYSESKVGAVERGEQVAFCTRADEFLKTDGLFGRMREALLTAEAVPEWFRPWADVEREATEIAWYEPLLVPGLLQTEDYARILLEDGSPGEAESLLAARLARQAVLERAAVVAIIDESVLRRRVGPPEVMHRQLVHLTTSPAVVQVVPTDAQTYRHLDGSFALAMVDGAQIGYVDTPARGFIVERREIVSRMRRYWDAIRAEALPRGQSKSLITKAAQAWKP